MPREIRLRPRVAALLASGIVALAVSIGGIPLALAVTVGIVLVLLVLPGDARAFLFDRLRWSGFRIGLAMAFVWMLVHNYPDASRLDEPGPVGAMERYVRWLGDLVAGDLGPSQYSETVGEGIARSLPISLQLLAYSQLIALALAIPGAMLGARLRGRAGDVAARAVSLLGLSMPIFVIGPILVQAFGLGELRLFGREIGWKLFPVVRYVPAGDGLGDHLASMTLPSLTLGVSTAAIYLVLLRSEIVQQLALPHVELARAKGLPARRIVRVHALRPAAPSTIAAVAAQSGWVLGNVVIIERIFLMPGFGDYTLVAIGRRDVLAVAGALFVAALIIALVNLVADALLLVVDPRLGVSGS